MHDFLPYLPMLGGAVGLVCLVGAFFAGRRRRLVENLSTSKTTGVFIGLVELKGTAECARPLTSYLAEQPCVWYQWSVDEHWSRTVTETYTDHEGKTRTRTRHESGWTTVADGGESTPFYLQDDCGVILIRPEGAKIEPLAMFDRTCGPADPLYYGKGPAHAVRDSDHRRRFAEYGIPEHASLYVMGQARERQDIVAAEIARDPDAPMFLISTRSEEQIGSGMKWGERAWVFSGWVLFVGSVVGRDAAAGIPLETRLPLYAGATAAYLAAAVLAWIWMVFNSLVDLRHRVRRAWSLVEIELKRRHDLIPNLVQAVRGCRDHERTVQSELAALRGQLRATPPGVEGPDYHAVRDAVLAVAERYPELKADANFAALQKSLIETEERIALARGYFNDIATHYNTRLEQVPERYVAWLGAMKPQPLMEADAFERAPVSIGAWSHGSSDPAPSGK